MNIMWERVARLKKTPHFRVLKALHALKFREEVQGVSLHVLESHICKLRFIPSMSKSVVGLIFSQIRDFLAQGPIPKVALSPP